MRPFDETGSMYPTLHTENASQLVELGGKLIMTRLSMLGTFCIIAVANVTLVATVDYAGAPA